MVGGGRHGVDDGAGLGADAGAASAGAAGGGGGVDGGGDGVRNAPLLPARRPMVIAPTAASSKHGRSGLGRPLRRGGCCRLPSSLPRVRTRVRIGMIDDGRVDEREVSTVGLLIDATRIRPVHVWMGDECMSRLIERACEWDGDPSLACPIDRLRGKDKTGRLAQSKRVGDRKHARTSAPLTRPSAAAAACNVRDPIKAKPPTVTRSIDSPLRSIRGFFKRCLCVL